MLIYTYTRSCRIQTDAMNNDERRLLYKYLYLSLYCKGSKRVTQGLRVRGSWRPNISAIYWPPLLWPSALCLSRSPELLNRRPRGPLCWVRAFSTASCHQLVSKHHRGSRGPLRPGVAFPTTSRLQLQLNSNFLSWLSYILVHRPLTRLLNLCNGMFDRHQAEITVMQFTGHSLLVHQSMSVPWDFFYLVPFHQPNPIYAISFDHWQLGCVTSFRCITLERHICPGRRSKYNITCCTSTS